MSDPFVEALKQLCEAEGGYKQVARTIGANYQTLYQIVAGILLPSGKPRGVGRQLRERLDRAYPGWSTPAAREPRAAYQAHSVSLENITVIPSLSWDELMTKRERLPQQFQCTAPDDSMAPSLPAGTIIYFDSSITPISGDGVLVSDEDGNLYIRQYKARRANHWEAHAFNAAVLPLDSRQDGLRVLAVVTGQRARWSGAR